MHNFLKYLTALSRNYRNQSRNYEQMQALTVSSNADREWELYEKMYRDYGPTKDANGKKEWWVRGQRHRVDGPAVENADGEKQWWVRGQLHRDDGPAIEYANSNKEWWVRGQRHRVDGPAVEYANGHKEWWVNGKRQNDPELRREGLDRLVSEAITEALQESAAKKIRSPKLLPARPTFS